MPKRGAWYRYYAGYSSEFVNDVLIGLRHSRDPGRPLSIADPWNGAGTTTQVAEEHGIMSWGGDINPAMVVVAKARLLGSHVAPSEIALSRGILRLATQKNGYPAWEEEPLAVWFRDQSARFLRSIEIAIGELLQPRDQPQTKRSLIKDISALSPLGAFFYLALFRTVRQLVHPFRSSNPTWVKRPKSRAHCLAPSRSTIQELFQSQVQEMVRSAAKVPPFGQVSLAIADATQLGQDMGAGNSGTNPRARIEVASSLDIPLNNASVGAVVGSPPYCTRIDYAVATSPELAALGFGERDFRALRQNMIGTSTVSSEALAIDPTWGKTCRKFLRRVGSHRSKASSSYYLKNHLQYFNGLSKSLAEIHRILEARALCVLVLQDSHYKEVHNPLPNIVEEMGNELGWVRLKRHDYRKRQIMAHMHRAGRTYRKSTQATETVLILQRP